MPDEMNRDVAHEERRSPPEEPTDRREHRLSQLGEYEVKPGFPDIRGWPARGSNGLELGIVGELLVDMEHLEVSAVDVHLGVGAAGVRGNVVASSRVPIEAVRIMPDRYVIVDVDTIPCDDVVLLGDEPTTLPRVPCGQIGVRRKVERVARPVSDVEVRRDATGE